MTHIFMIASSNFKDGQTPLITAAIEGNAEAVTLLLDRGANIESEDGVSNFFPEAWYHYILTQNPRRCAGWRGGSFLCC